MDSLKKERIELALKASNEGLWLWDVGSHEVLYSERSLRFLGYPEGAEVKLFQEMENYFHTDDVPHVKSSIQEVIEDPQNNSYLAVEARVKRGNGSYLWLRIRASVVYADDGQLQFLAGSMIDISRRKEVERKLDDERFLLQQLIENIPNNLYFKDRDSRFVMVNQATADKMGVGDVENLIGKTDHDFFNASHADFSRHEELEAMENIVERKAKLVRELWNGNDDSWGLSYKVPWLDSNGNVLGIFGVTSDVTEMVQVQQRFTRAAGELKDINDNFHEELELAKQVQQAALDPSPASFPRGVSKVDMRAQFTTFYKPDSEMAGDFYEVFAITPEKAGVLICDVMGHGVKAALAVAMIRGLIDKEKSIALEPKEFLRVLNENLVGIFGSAGIQMFATACYMVLDLESEELVLASAGHPMPLQVRDNNALTLFEPSAPSRGPALGMIAGAEYKSSRCSLEGMKQFILYTDGIYEVEDTEGNELGVVGLISRMNHQGGDVGACTVDNITHVAHEYSGSQDFGDDVCILAVDLKKA